MKLHVYCGLRAIAYIITQGADVVKHGIKRVNISFDHYYEYLAGLPVSKRINRRQKRQMRRNLWRFKSRRQNLKRLLQKHGYNCEGEMSREQILKLRVKGLGQALSKEELYMVLLSLQQKRGYKSLRGVSDNENSDYLKEIERHEDNLGQYPSIAAYLLTLDSSTNIIFTRKSYEKEFHAIMDRQEVDAELRNKIFGYIYYQNPLKKGKVGKCKYEPNRIVAHASNPMYQEFRIWRDVMNIVIYDGYKNELEIPFELRQKWFERCLSGSNLTKAGCVKDLLANIRDDDYRLDIIRRRFQDEFDSLDKEFAQREAELLNKIDGTDKTVFYKEVKRLKQQADAKRKKIAAAKKLALKKELQKIKGENSSLNYQWYSGNIIAGNPLAMINKLTGLGEVQTLWQELFSAVDSEKLAIFLRSKYSFSDHVINELLDLDLMKLGYGEYSIKAIRKLLPLMQQGMRLKEAALQVYGVVEFKDVALRNVVLEQHFESYKALVAEIKKRYPVTEMQFEIDHLLKLGNKGRKALAQQKRKEEKFKKENAGLTDYNRLKLQLWTESGGISPYQPDYIIPKEELFTDKYNIDHIVAKSKLFETGYANMVLAPTDLNFDKQRTTAVEYAHEVLGLNGKWEEAVEKFPESKQQFLRMKDADIPGNWVSKRQNSDYHTKCFGTLGGINIPNKLLNKYLRDWGVHQYGEQDARHYLAKCWVLANMSQETVNYFDNLKAQATGQHSQALYAIRPELPRLDFENAPVFMPRIKFTRKTKFGYTPRFGLHGETVFGKRKKLYRNAKGEIVTDYFYKVRKPVAGLTPPMVEKIMDKAIQRKIKARIEEKGNHEEGILSLVEDPATHNGKPIKRVSIAQGAERIFPLHSTDSKGRTGNKAAFERKVDYVFSEKNYCLLVKLNSRGQVNQSVVTLMEFIDALNKGEHLGRGDGLWLRENERIEVNGKQYFIIGAKTSPRIRNVYSLAATEDRILKAEEWKVLKKLHINHLGEVVGTEVLADK